MFSNQHTLQSQAYTDFTNNKSKKKILDIGKHQESCPLAKLNNTKIVITDSKKDLHHHRVTRQNLIKTRLYEQ
jgi:hypothetical protein